MDQHLAQNELVLREIDVERRELGANTESEQNELAAMYEGHGMEPDTAALAASDVMRDHGRALTVHAKESWASTRRLPSPWLASILSFACFVVGALLPVIRGSSLGHGRHRGQRGDRRAGRHSIGLTIGSFAERNRVQAAVRQVVIMLAACVITYSIGKVLDVNVS